MSFMSWFRGCIKTKRKEGNKKMINFGAKDSYGKNVPYKVFSLDPDKQICLYRNCRHKRKEHDGKKCKCRHFQTEITGIGFQPTAIIIFNEKDAIKDTDIIFHKPHYTLKGSHKPQLTRK